MHHEDTRYPPRRFFADIIRFVKPYRGKFFLASFLRLSGDIALLYPPYAFAQIINLLTNNPDGSSIPSFVALVVLSIIATVYRYVAVMTAKMLGNRIAERGSLDVGHATISHLTALDISWHEKENAGSKLKRIQRAIDGFDDIIKIWFQNLIEIIVNFVGMVFIVSTADWKIGTALAFFMATYTPLSFYLLKKAVVRSRAVNYAEEHVYSLLFEIINNIRSVKLMSVGKHLMKKLGVELNGLMSLIGLRINAFQSRNFYIGSYAEVFRLVIIFVIGYGIIRGYYEVGFLVLFNGYFNSLRTSAEELSNVSETLAVSKQYVSRAMDILNEPIRIDNDQNRVVFPKNWRTLTLRNISFGYGERRVLNNVSMEIKRGEKIGIVGLSGAGKSTLFKLFCKEHESYDGEISYDDIPLRTIQKKDYLRHISVVLQETEVFNFSLLDNILIAREDRVPKKTVDRALRTAHVADFVGKLPQGIDTVIGEKGVKLSGGEKQRLGIARAIIKEPQILFLDEATSHLDLESEEKIQDSLGKFFEQVTAIVIAHRLTTIKKMDRILVMEGGKIIESGSFDELYRKRGRFFELWEKQRL